MFSNCESLDNVQSVNRNPEKCAKLIESMLSFRFEPDDWKLLNQRTAVPVCSTRPASEINQHLGNCYLWGWGEYREEYVPERDKAYKAYIQAMNDYDEFVETPIDPDDPVSAAEYDRLCAEYEKAYKEYSFAKSMVDGLCTTTPAMLNILYIHRDATGA